MQSRGAFFLTCALFIGSVAQADELVSLIREYSRAVGKVGGAPKDRPAKVKKQITPILEKIGALDSDTSLSWLAAELDKKKVFPEIRAAIPAALLKNSSDKAARALLAGFARRPVQVQSATLAALRESKRKIGLQEAKLLVTQLGGSSKDSDGRAEILEDAAMILAKTTDEDVKAWLGDDAWSAAGKQPDRLIVLARVAAALELSAAQPHVAKLVTHRSPDVAAAAIEALGKLGVGDSTSAIAKAITKGRGNLQMRIKALDALAQGGGSGVDVVIESAKSRDPELRAVAMGSLALAKGNQKAMEALFEGLNDRDPNVRSVALRALRQVRVKPMIGALIDAFDEQKDRSFKIKILETLVTLSGQNFGPVAEDWKKWWSVAQDTFEFPKTGETGFTQVTQRDLSYFGIEVSSKRLGFLVDISSSMRQQVSVREGSLDDDEESGRGGRTRVDRDKKKGGGEEKKGKAMKIEVLKKELTRLLKKLPADTSVNILTFDAQFKAWQKALQPIAGRGRAKAVSFVKSINTGSGTNVFDTLEAALKDKRVDTIYLLTDGQPTRGRITDPGTILSEIKLQNRIRGVTIHTIAFGEESDLLKKLAAQNGGQYRFVDSY